MHANQELQWLPMDTKQLYNKNLKEKYTQLEKYGWIDAPITYKFNSYGFRSDEFSLDPNIVFLGCSHTCGIGMPIEQTWASIVSKTLGLKNFNLGVGGSSNDTAFRLGQHWIPQLNPNIVIFLSPERSRFELHNDKHIQDWGTWQEHHSEDYKMLWRTWILNNTNSNMNYLKNKLALEQICDKLNIKLLHTEYRDISCNGHDLARDLGHGGTKANQLIADHFLSKL